MKASLELHRQSLLSAASRIERGEISPVELTEAVLTQIERAEPKINAFITVTADGARAAAVAHERMIARGTYLGPLHGIPISLKDNIYTRGIRTTAGSKILGNHIPDEDATVTARLKDAGAIIVGKTNLHEFAWGGTTDNPHYGPTRNPWNVDRFPAGSSGGSGASLAAREGFGSIGTDTAGSIRLPAAVNGIVGLRPTIGRVSNYNIVPLAWTMDTAGPMTRTVADCAAMFQVIAGHDPNDEASIQAPATDYSSGLDRGIAGIRIGTMRDYSFTHLQPAVRDCMQQALKILETSGANITEVQISSIEGNIAAQLNVLFAESSTYHQHWLRTQADDYGADVRERLEAGEIMLATHYLQAQRYRTLLRSELVSALQKVDVLICPTISYVATPYRAETVTLDGVEAAAQDAIMQFTGLSCLTGLPAISVPCGFSPDGLPVGMQIVGRPFDEATLFRIGHAYQEATDWHLREPVL